MDVTSRIERALTEAIARAEVPGCPPRLAAAMRYAVFPRGARVRPRLCHSVAAACGEDNPYAGKKNPLTPRQVRKRKRLIQRNKR